jgi:tetratricopeptide (TPR) repeat protein
LRGAGRRTLADQIAAQALALARRSGDRLGQEMALTTLAIRQADLAADLRLFNQALDAANSAAYSRRRAQATGNIGDIYAKLGLHRRARRLTLNAADISRSTGDLDTLLTWTSNLALLGVRGGVARRCALVRRRSEGPDPQIAERALPRVSSMGAGCLALREGQPAEAARMLRKAAKKAASAGVDGRTSVPDPTPHGRISRPGMRPPHWRLRAVRSSCTGKIWRRWMISTPVRCGGATARHYRRMAKMLKLGSARAGVALAARAHREPERRRAAPQLLEQESEHREIVSRGCSTRVSASCRATDAKPTSPAR